jgi:UDP-N-acetylmuramate dehydrogenase
MKIQTDVNLKPYNSFGISQSAAHFAEVENLGDLKQALSYGEEHFLSVHILGQGSNTLFIQDYPGLLIHMACLGIERFEDSGIVKAACGENWHQFVEYCLKNNLHGIENLALIPGTIGAAPIQNIGAYGVELEQLVLGVEVFNRETATVEVLSREQCEFSYRDSIFKSGAKNKYVVLSLALQLNASPVVHTDYAALKQQLTGVEEPGPRDVFEAVCSIRQTKLPDPSALGNAGSFFKNPLISQDKFSSLSSEYPDIPCFDSGEEGLLKVPAAWFIEKAGWKGRRKGDAGVHEQHALVLVNYGEASGEDILLLAQDISNSVLQSFGIALQPEVNFV